LSISFSSIVEKLVENYFYGRIDKNPQEGFCGAMFFAGLMSRFSKIEQCKIVLVNTGRAVCRTALERR
jgi:hypothetical protein